MNIVSKQAYWAQWEETVKDKLNGKLVKASGRYVGYKGDVKTSKFLCDCKATETRIYTLTGEMWHKLSMWALNEGKMPLMAILIIPDKEIGVVSLNDYLTITGKEYDDVVSNIVGRKSLSISSDKRRTVVMNYDYWDDTVLVDNLNYLIEELGLVDED